MINFLTRLYLIIVIILNPISLNILFDNQMSGKVFLPAVIIFDLLLILLAYLTYKSKNKLDSIIVFFSLVLLVCLSEFAARKYLYNSKTSFNFVLQEPVFFEDERKNFREKYYKCAIKKSNYYSKLYFFSATKNTNCDGWSTVKSSNGPWIRNTTNFSDQSNINNIWFFGGSTMFSALLSDSDTIPSIMSKKLKDNNYDYFIENFGRGGLDLHYEVSNFINLLRFTNNIPEIVIFYDGYNDIFNKIKHGGEFFLFNFSQSLMYDENNFHKSIYFFSEHLSNLSVIFKNTLGKRIRKFNIDRLSKKKKNYTIDEISQDYINSIYLADNIAKLYNVKIFFFLQPASFSRKNPVGIEKKHHETENAEIARSVYQKLTNKISKNNFYDLSMVFDAYSEQFFYDNAHLNKKGNLVISSEMYKIIFER